MIGVKNSDHFYANRIVVPAGFDVIELPQCKMLIFQGAPYDDEQFEEAISSLWERIEVFNPVVYGIV